jgi:hypothetical protein
MRNLPGVDAHQAAGDGVGGVGVRAGQNDAQRSCPAGARPEPFHADGAVDEGQMGPQHR